jgi:uncharacterized BrkB/YihY/UPF0761 family membrane protein
VLVLLWVYYSSLILFFGTCLTIATIQQRGGKVTPKKAAARIRVLVEDSQEETQASRSES